MGILSGVISFLGGSVFRMIWGEFSAWISEKQEHTYEIERMKLQAELDAAQHSRNLEAQRLQAELGYKTIEAQSHSVVDGIEANAWLSAVESTSKQTGIKWVDAWNAMIRPGGATWALLILTGEAITVLNFHPKENTIQVCFAFLGLFVADRALGKKGK